MNLHNTAAALAAAVAIIGLAACQPAGTSAAEMEAIKAVNGAWAGHYNAGDAGAVADLYWPDASLMAPGAPARVGSDAIREQVAADIAGAKAAGLSMNIDHGPVAVLGTTAWQEGTFQVTDGSGATVDTGKYLSVLEKRDGTWRLLRDIYNSDGAAVAVPAGPDAAEVDPAHYKVEFENNRVRVLRINYGPNEKSVMHSHPEGVVVFLSDADARFGLPDGTTSEMHVKAGMAGWSDAETHAPENLGNKPFELIQIELK